MTDTLNGRAAANIRAELARRQMTQEQLADQIGMGRTAVTAMLANQTGITLTKLERIAGLFGIEPAKLLND